MAPVGSAVNSAEITSVSRLVFRIGRGAAGHGALVVLPIGFMWLLSGLSYTNLEQISLISLGVIYTLLFPFAYFLGCIVLLNAAVAGFKSDTSWNRAAVGSIGALTIVTALALWAFTAQISGNRVDPMPLWEWHLAVIGGPVAAISAIVATVSILEHRAIRTGSLRNSS